MRRVTLFIALLLVPIAAAFAASEAGPEDLERNAHRLEKLSADPAHYRRLKRDLRAFYHLSPAKREQLRQLDRALHEEDSASQSRLWEALDRFNVWLEHLPDEDRRRIIEAPSRDDRLRVIKELREQEFIRRLPQKVRESLEQLAPERRGLALTLLRKQEQQLRLVWKPGYVPRIDRPVRPADLSPDQEQYLKDVLRPMLGQDDKAKLDRAEGKWPDYVLILMELDKNHPVILPGPSTGPKNVAMLGEPFKNALNELQAKRSAVKNQVRRLPGNWPDFAIELKKLFHANQVNLVQQLGPCRPADFSPPVRDFITKDFLPKLTDKEKEDLEKAVGQWPEYPEMLRDLARQHRLEIPMMSFPGASKLREKADQPEVPDRILREFLTELTPEERTHLHLSPEDPESRQRLTEEFFKPQPQDAETPARDRPPRDLESKAGRDQGVRSASGPDEAHHASTICFGHRPGHDKHAGRRLR